MNMSTSFLTDWFYREAVHDDGIYIHVPVAPILPIFITLCYHTTRIRYSSERFQSSKIEEHAGIMSDATRISVLPCELHLNQENGKDPTLRS